MHMKNFFTLVWWYLELHRFTHYTIFKCARYDLDSAVEYGCTLNDLITSANNGEKLKLTFTSN